MRVYEKAMQHFEAEQNRPKHTVYTYPYTIEDQKSYLLNRITADKEVSFTELMQAFPDKIGLIFNFLAILEMLQLNIISIQVSDGFNNFRITPFRENQAA